MQAVFLDFGTMGSEALDPTPLTDVLPDLTVFDATSQDQVDARIARAECVLLNKVTLDAPALERAERLRFIGLAATGVDNVDLATARTRGIAVANIRAYCTQSVVEHVFGALLTLAHSLNRYGRDVRNGQWQTSRNFCLLNHPIRELSGMTLGIVGHGVLGRAVADVARAFGMEVLLARRAGTEATDDDGRIDLPELLDRADVVSLHCPLNNATRGLIDGSALAAMKSSAILINTARGALVDTQALADALARGDIYAAAIDVLPEEPPVSGDPLLEYDGDNLLLTPHVAWATQEARQNAISEIAANVVAFRAGEERNRIV